MIQVLREIKTEVSKECIYCYFRKFCCCSGDKVKRGKVKGFKFMDGRANQTDLG